MLSTNDSPISPAKLAANQANARKSTGPQSAEGKARVAQNSTTHGLSSQELLLPGESRQEYDQLQDGYLIQIKPLPSGPERTLFDALVAAAWKLRRLQRLETDLQSQSPDLLAQLDDDKLQKKLDNLARHQARLERTYHRSLQELTALQTNRAHLMVLNESREVLPGLAVVKVFTKQTHQVPEALKRKLQACRIMHQRMEVLDGGAGDSPALKC